MERRQRRADGRAVRAVAGGAPARYQRAGGGRFVHRRNSDLSWAERGRIQRVAALRHGAPDPRAVLYARGPVPPLRDAADRLPEDRCRGTRARCRRGRRTGCSFGPRSSSSRSRCPGRRNVEPTRAKSVSSCTATTTTRCTSTVSTRSSSRAKPLRWRRGLRRRPTSSTGSPLPARPSSRRQPRGLQAHAESVGRRLTEVEAQANAAERESTAVAERATVAETRAQQSERANAELRDSLREKESLLLNAQRAWQNGVATVERLDAAIANATSELRAAELRARELTQVSAEASQRAESAARDANAALAAVGAAEARAQAAEACKQAAQASAEKSEARLHHVEARSREAESNAQAAEAKALQEGRRAQQALADAAQAEVRAQHAEARAQHAEALALREEAVARDLEVRAASPTRGSSARSPARCRRKTRSPRCCAAAPGESRRRCALWRISFGAGHAAHLHRRRRRDELGSVPRARMRCGVHAASRDGPRSIIGPRPA